MIMILLVAFVCAVVAYILATVFPPTARFAALIALVVAILVFLSRSGFSL